ncbi:hypothetical protein [Ramlibacter ginsenosidimutans]|nr:hypothetical protein [Ramlibacter ginsenosidimutans]
MAVGDAGATVSHQVRLITGAASAVAGAISRSSSPAAGLRTRQGN